MPNPGHPPRLRLLHVTQPTAGGTAVVVRNLAAGAARAGYDVTVASPNADGVREWAANAGLRWVELPLERLPSLADFRNVAALRHLMAEHDVVQLHSSKAGAVGRLAAFTLRRRRRPRVVFTPHAWSWYVGGLSAGPYRVFERWAARYSDVISVVSSNELADGRRVLGREAPLILIANGVDTGRFSPSGPQAKRTSAPLIVSVGRLSRQKGQDRLIRVLARMDDTVRLRLVGEGPDESDLRAQASAAGLAGRVEFVGAGDPRPHLRAADVVALPSRWEGMSLVLLEAMAVGAAVVSTQCGGSDALGPAGVLIPADDDQETEGALLVALENLLADPDLRKRLGSAARARAIANHSPTRVMADYDHIWNLKPDELLFNWESF